MPFSWSNQIYCKRCGGTNLWFFVQRDKTRKSGIKNTYLCKECFREVKKIRYKKGGQRVVQQMREAGRRYKARDPEHVRKLQRESEARCRIRRQRRGLL